LKRKKRSNRSYVIGLLILLLAVATITILIYRSARNRNLIARQVAELQQHRISELEKEKQLNRDEIGPTGGEAERTRMARDLHDGLGGMLSSV